MSSSGLFCPQCGATNEPQAAFCAKCGAPQQAAPVFNTPVFAQPPDPGGPSGQFGPGTAVAPAFAAPIYPVAMPPVSYAGFWIRFLAYIIDGALMSLVTLPLFFVVMGMGVAGANSRDPQAAVMALMATMPILLIVTGAGGWLYFALMESSTKQGTLGKMLLKLKVADPNGNRIGFGRATGRYFAKWISSFTLSIGWIMAGFTEKKQALHDFIAVTVVLKTNY
jgi:uncharacterized RDD family membrane protein YckC